MDGNTIDGVVADLERGYRVLVVGSGSQVKSAQELLARRLSEAGDLSSIRWTHGSEEIRHKSGGRARFLKSAAAMRSHSVDVVVAFEPITDDVRLNAYITMNAARDGGRLVATS